MFKYILENFQYGHLSRKNLNNYDCCMLYNWIIFWQCWNMPLFRFFFFHRDTCLNKAFSFATDYDYDFDQSLSCKWFSENDAETFFGRGKLKQHTQESMSILTKKPLFYISLIWTASSYQYSNLPQTITIYTKFYLLSLYISSHVYIENLWCSMSSYMSNLIMAYEHDK